MNNEITVEKILEELVSFNTINDLENDKIMNYIMQYLERLNFNCTLYGDNKKILIASIGEIQKFGFVGHTDTVDYGKKFGSDPFKLIEKNNNFYGLGACDMKGGISAILKAVDEIDFNKLKYGVKLIFTYDEEVLLRGIKYFNSLKIDYPEYLVIGEPTDNIPMNGSKGVIMYRFEFDGISTHSSRPISSSNKKCIKFLNDLLRLENYFQKRYCDEYEYGHTTMNYGIIHGGDRANIVSSYTYSTCDFRITKDIEEYNYIKNYVHKLTKKHNVRYNIELDFLPFYNNDKIINYYEDICKNKRKKFFGLSEASAMGKNRVILGPGPITAHEDCEYISKNSLYKTVEIYKNIILKICSESGDFNEINS